MNYQNLGYRWLKTQKKYRNLQRRLHTTTDTSLVYSILEKIERIKKRILNMNRKWKIGVATSFLLAWLAANPAQAQFASPFELDSINGTNGFTINGLNLNDRLGRSVQIVNDINGDGFDDIAISMNGYDNSASLGAGTVYIVFGTNAGFPASFDLATLDGSNGFTFTGINSFPNSGIEVTGLDDINGDGFGDFAIGAKQEASGNGQTYVVFGKNTAFNSTMDATALDGTNGFIINGSNGDQIGSSTGQADLNGDGLTDIIIGAMNANVLPFTQAGKVFVVFGSAGSFGATLGLTTLNGTNGFTVYGNVANANIGIMLSNLNDFNGDGIDDILIDGGQVNESHIVFGSTLGFADSLNVAALDGNNGFTINGFPYAGFSQNAYTANAAGDINGDGLGDIIIGSYTNVSEANNIKGTSFIIFGSSSPFGSSFDITSIDGSNGFLIESIKKQDRLGELIGGVGDINGDGVGDVFIGNRSANTGYVLFGKMTSFGDTLNLASINGRTGVDIKAKDFYQFSMGSGGDVNGDGINDFILGSARNNYYTGTSYIIFGDDRQDTTAPIITDLNPVDNVTNASRSNNFNLTFDERIEKGTGNIIIHKTSDDSIFETIDVVGSNVEINIKSVVINPVNQLQPSDDYYIKIDNSAFKDVWGNDFVGINDNTTWNFKTVSANEFASTVEISSLDGSNGFSFGGVPLVGQIYGAVSNAGDFNGDGFDDILLSYPYAATDTSEVYLVFGKAGGFTSSFDLSAIDGTNGIRFEKFSANAIIGYGPYGSGGLSAAGDINGDGLDDVIFASQIDWNDTVNSYGGEVYIMFGKDVGISSPFNLANLDGNNGFTVSGLQTMIKSPAVSDNFTFVVGGDFDINADGVDDVIIGAYESDISGMENAGKAYVIFGSSSGFSTFVDATSLNGTNGFSVDGLSANSRLGASVSGAGDINGDGIEDLMISAYNTSPDGVVYIIFGKNGGFGSSIDLSTLDGTNGFAVSWSQGAVFGRSLGDLGDVNGDGIDDIIIGAHYGVAGGVGVAYVVFGKNTAFSPSLDVSSLDGTNGFAFLPEVVGDYAGFSVSGAGDLNGDGIDDMMVGAPVALINGNTYAGKNYVVFGKNTGYSPSMDLSTIEGTNGFVIAGSGEGDTMGYKMSSAGDMNNDGADDIIVGGYYNTGSYVVFGVAAQTEIGGVAAEDYNALIDLYNSTDGTNWTNNTNWNSAANVDTWFGVTVVNARVTGIDLSDNDGGSDGSTTDGNNLVGTVSSQLADLTELTQLRLSNNALTGAIPSVLSGLANLQTVDISNNDFSDLPDISALAGVTTIDVTNNNFTFEDIEPNVSISGIVYSPQKLVPAPAGINLDEGQELKISITVGGDANQYQWVKDNVDISGATADSLVVANATSADNGTYFLSTTNTNVAGLTLQSEEVVVTVTLDTIQGVRTTHYNAIMDLYNDAGGSNWTDKTNWNTTTQVSGWFGIETIDVDIAEIRLPSNNLQGSVPASISDISSLVILDLSDNFIETLPDLTGLGNLDSLNVEGNNLDFTSLETNAGIDGITYGDQEPTMVDPVDTILYVGEPYILTVSVPGDFNKYQWYKDSLAMEGETNDSLVIATLNRASMGIFYAEVTNDSVPDLVIPTSVNSVLAGADIAGSVTDTNDQVLDEGRISMYKVNNGAAFDTTAIFDLVPGDGGIFSFPKTVLADYIFLANIDTIAFEDVLPTYWSSTIFWEEADTLKLNENQPNIDISAAITPLEKLGGNGLIFGSVFEDLPTNGRIAARRKLPKASVSVRKKRASSRKTEDAPIFDLVGYVITDENGDYSMDGLTPGTYRFNVQYPGIPMDTVNSNIDIEVTDNGAQQTNQVIATVTEEGIILETSPLEIYRNNYKRWAEVYPVPSSNKVFVQLDQYRNVDVMLTISTITGRTISIEKRSLNPNNPAPLELDIQSLESGVYILEVKSTRNVGSEPLVWQTRFVKKD